MISTLKNFVSGVVKTVKKPLGMSKMVKGAKGKKSKKGKAC